MATAIPNTICLTATGLRRQGQTRRNPYTSLHGYRVSDKKPEVDSREEEEDVNAPPKDSSDEEGPSVFEAEGYGQASDDSEFEEVKVGKPRSSPRNPASPPRTVNKSHIPGTLCPDQNEMQPSSGKRKSGYSSNDAFNISFEMSQPKRQKKSIGYGKTKAKPKPRNIHETPPAEQGEKCDGQRKASPATSRPTSDFVRPPTQGLLAERKCPDLVALVSQHLIVCSEAVQGKVRKPIIARFRAQQGQTEGRVKSTSLQSPRSALSAAEVIHSKSSIRTPCKTYSGRVSAPN